MKKAYLALAVAAAMPSLASAQTSITLSGSIDGSVEWRNSGANPSRAAQKGQGTDLRVSDGVMSGSRVIIAGSEDIGRGLKGLFALEHRFQVDTGQVGSKFWNAYSFVGVQGGFGAFRIGRQYTTMFRALAPGDLTGYTFYYNAVGLAGTDIRWDNAVEYRTPNLGGFVGYAQFAPGEVPGTVGGGVGAAVNLADATSQGLTASGSERPANTGDAWGAGVTGAIGPIGIGAGFQTRKNGTFNLPGGAVAGLGQTKQYGVGLNGKAGPFGIAGAWAQNKLGDQKINGYYGSMSLAVGPGTLYATYRLDKGSNGAVGYGQGLGAANYGAADVTREQGFGLTYMHGLSKRTFVYLAGGYGKQNYNSWISATGPAQGPGDFRRKINGAIGVRHFF